MKTLSFLLVLLLLLLPKPLLAWPATVLNVYDGDTVTVAPLGDEANPLFVRLYGVDAPDLKQSGGAAARAWLAKQLPEKSSVEIIPMGFDAYGRVYALLGTNGKVVNRLLLEQGHAWVWERACRAMVCRSWKSVEHTARDEGRGLWATKNPLAPWDFGKDGGEQLPMLPSRTKRPVLPSEQALPLDPTALIPTLEGLPGITGSPKKTPHDPKTWFEMP